MTRPKRYKRYSAEFKQEALRRAADEAMTDKAVCEELGISTRQFRRWHGEMAMLGQDANPGNPSPRYCTAARQRRYSLRRCQIALEIDPLRELCVAIYDLSRLMAVTVALEFDLHETHPLPKALAVLGIDSLNRD